MEYMYEPIFECKILTVMGNRPVGMPRPRREKNIRMDYRN
jgi:hypothetical protein